ncbi:mannose-1-phosphate guanylyltransferase (GDP) /mannose-6-phosphate isomerase, type 2 [Sphingomonas palmae]|uniref:mannose-1-phosphate guanylyltransferase n=1 Tax=Sphingomonas palmae TaxID=1855283 RepID=A0A1H7HTY7_9SPHN|nr:mannose-1-phosphate guanylyltransferase/mannose-6-phosphate isomerase [Sphingomonas palmae]SEK53614.1 mannose-1-phosphate guanylyltransferase (GDP) /mannose-6-phosphate isomerase, type 2 [Sphingomonas palmae]
MSAIVPVILSGGSGTRLWPMSRPERPKQFLALTAAETMLQLTAARAHGDAFAAPIVVANAAHADQVETQLAEITASPQAIILEPAGRNTAPAIALAALEADGKAPLLVMPSDHVIADPDAFHAAIHVALPLVEDGWMVTFGITPDAPETGYGYIKVGDEVAAGVHRVARFVEKPQRDVAEAMIASGDHAWNGGIFLFCADAYLKALEQFRPDIFAAAKASLEGAQRDGVRVHPDKTAFEASPSDSIDYAVMEKAERVAVVPVAMGWSDVGSWDALHTIADNDEHGNVVNGDAIVLDSRNCLVRSDGARIAMVGVENLIVVASGNDILILPRGRGQDVKLLQEEMNRK